MKTIRLALAQINTTIGDLKGNSEKIITYIKDARNAEVDIVAFPELAVTGFHPEGLLSMPDFIDQNINYIKSIIKETADITAIVGFVDRQKHFLFNAAAVIHDKKLICTYHKRSLNAHLLNEPSYFCKGKGNKIFELKGITFAVNIGEDCLTDNIIESQAAEHAEFIINISAFPFFLDKDINISILKKIAQSGMGISITNHVGGQNELVFIGRSLIADNNGNLVLEADTFKESLMQIDLNCDFFLNKKSLKEDKKSHPVILSCINDSKNKVFTPIPMYSKAPISTVEMLFGTLRLGLRDYVKKNGFSKVAIGLSGGIDCSLVASLAVSALGHDNVTGISMPSQYTSHESMEDAELLAHNLKINILTIPIIHPFESFTNLFDILFSGMPSDTTEENLQSRIRGLILMSISNKFGWLVLNTGNESEANTGYCTLYGDSVGGFATIRNVPKHQVYNLSKHFNKISGLEIIPRRVFEKEPTAELRPNQKDSDSLPPYNILDPILEAYLYENKSVSEISATGGFDEALVINTIKMVHRSEYKRQQCPPGIRLLEKNHRFPIINKLDWL